MKWELVTNTVDEGVVFLKVQTFHLSVVTC